VNSFYTVFCFSQEALVGAGGVAANDESQPGSSRTLNRSPSGDDKFWVPPNLKRQASVCHSENADTSGGNFLLFEIPCLPTNNETSSPKPLHLQETQLKCTAFA
jgi:hypothetical protein